MARRFRFLSLLAVVVAVGCAIPDVEIVSSLGGAGAAGASAGTTSASGANAQAGSSVTGSAGSSPSGGTESGGAGGTGDAGGTGVAGAAGSGTAGTSSTACYGMVTCDLGHTCDTFNRCIRTNGLCDHPGSNVLFCDDFEDIALHANLWSGALFNVTTDPRAAFAGTSGLLFQRNAFVVAKTVNFAGSAVPIRISMWVKPNQLGSTIEFLSFSNSDGKGSFALTGMPGTPYADKYYWQDLQQGITSPILPDPAQTTGESSAQWSCIEVLIKDSFTFDTSIRLDGTTTPFNLPELHAADFGTTSGIYGSPALGRLGGLAVDEFLITNDMQSSCTESPN